MVSAAGVEARRNPAWGGRVYPVRTQVCRSSKGSGLCHCNNICNTAMEPEGAPPALTRVSGWAVA